MRNGTEVYIEWLLEKKAESIAVIELDRDILVDYFLIATAKSETQMSGILEHVVKKARESDKIFRVDGKPETEWIVIDFGDTLIHLFTDRLRRLYNLEELGIKKEGVEQNEQIGRDSQF